MRPVTMNLIPDKIKKMIQEKREEAKQDYDLRMKIRADAEAKVAAERQDAKIQKMTQEEELRAREGGPVSRAAKSFLKDMIAPEKTEKKQE